MRLKLSLLAAAAVAAVCAKAAPGDTIKIYHPGKVVVINTPRGYNITADGTDSTYMFERTFNADGTSTLSSTRTAAGMPAFTNAIRNNFRKYRSHWMGLEIGLVMPAGTKTGGLNGPDGVKGKPWQSWDIAFNFFAWGLPIGHGGFGAFTGLGVDWRNIRLKGDNIFSKDPETGKTTLVKADDGMDLDYSRVHMFSITVPLMLEWHNTKTRGNDFWINAGAVVNFNPYTTYRTKWHEGSVKCEDMTYKTRQQAVTADLKLAFGIGALGAFVKYSPMKVIRSGYGPDFCPLSFGLAIH